MRHLLSKGASPNTSDDEVLVQLAPKSALTQCRQQGTPNARTQMWEPALPSDIYLLRYCWQKGVNFGLTTSRQIVTILWLCRAGRRSCQR